MLNRYDVEGLDEAVFRRAVWGVFAEPQLDDVYAELPGGADFVLAAEYLPGQFDQRADSAAQCVQLMAQCERPAVRTATVYLMEGALSAADMEKIRRHVINPVERREASLARVDSLEMRYEVPARVPVLDGFRSMDDGEAAALIPSYGLAMDAADIAFCRDYFRSVDRDPTLTELRLLDTYWSDHCRHTTFLTELTDVAFEDADAEAAYRRYLGLRAELGRTKPVTLMDVATIGAKVLVKRGALTDLDESDEINACTIKVKVRVGGERQDWLLLFKNETHNHPTEIEPFGGAATCIGGAIRDPLSGRAYVYQAMRVTGAADPTRPVEETIPGKLPQRRLVTTAAAGYSSYGNQIGLATGLVEEIYHPGYAAKRMEIGAVIGAAPAQNVRREAPAPGDVVLLLGGRTGRDGCGGATGSSKSHTAQSLTTCGAEVQKGNAPEERKLQRLFRDPQAARMIKRCNDFGAGGVSVAIGELADGLEIDLDRVPRKYEGLDGTELAISESQERMAVVLAPQDVAAFAALADRENIEATAVARVTEAPRLVMRWNGETIVDIDRAFLNSNGAPKHAAARVAAPVQEAKPQGGAGFAQRMRALVSDLNQCSQRGLAERFDSTNGACSLLMPFGGRRQLTPVQAMASRIPLRGAQSDTASAMAYGFDPFASERSPYCGAYLAVVHSLAKLVACGAGTENVHLTFQEYFERMTAAPETWGKPLAALLGALDAQMDFGVAAIGGKDSMSGTFEQLHVPPTLVSFAVGVCEAADVRANAFTGAGSAVGLIAPALRENGLPDPESQKRVFARVTEMLRDGRASCAYAVGAGGMASAAFHMALGNGFGFAFAADAGDVFAPRYGAFLVEFAPDAKVENEVGRVTAERRFAMGGDSVAMDELEALWSARLESVFPTEAGGTAAQPPVYEFRAPQRRRTSPRIARPRVLIPVFPGTNCEYDTENAFLNAGAEPEILVVRNRTAAAVAESADRFADAVARAQIIFIPGGFSGGDEPDGSGKFITAFFRNPRIADRVRELLKARDGLIGGICNGFQALVKLGLVPYGEIRAAKDCAANADLQRHRTASVAPGAHARGVEPLAVADVRRARRGAHLSDFPRRGQVHRAASAGRRDGAVRSDRHAVLRFRRRADDGYSLQSQRLGRRHRGHHPRLTGACSARWVTASASAGGKPLYVNVPGNYANPMFRGAVDYFAK